MMFHLLCIALAAVAASVELDSCEKGCPRNLAPVCGSDHHTYNNECLFEIAQCKAARQNTRLTVLYKTFCHDKKSVELDPCEKGCPRNLAPVCGSDHHTYNNECLFEIAQCKAARQNTRNL